MKRWVLAAGLLAAAVTPSAMAADLDGVPPPQRWGGYDDPRYQRQAPPPAPAYDDEDDRDDGPPPARRYTDVPPPPGYAAPRARAVCVRSEEVRARLTSQGWNDFHDGHPVSQTAVTLRARRPSGRLFELTLDRCSGELVTARPLELRPFGPYAYRQPYGPYGPWRWGPERAPYAYSDRGYERPYAYRDQRRWNSD